MRALDQSRCFVAGGMRPRRRQQSDYRSMLSLHSITFDGGRLLRQRPPEIAHGERLTRVLGCRGCHGKDLQGKLWDDDPEGIWDHVGVEPDPVRFRRCPTRELRDLLTKGTHPRRSELWVMPSELFQHLAEPDLAALLAYLRTLPPAGKPSPDPRLGPRALREIASGEVKPTATLVTELRTVGPADLGPQHACGSLLHQGDLR